MFFKKKKEKEPHKLIMITISLINTSHDRTKLVWYFKDLTRFEEYKLLVKRFFLVDSSNLEIDEVSDYMNFKVPTGLNVYFAGCEIVDDFDEEN